MTTFEDTIMASLRSAAEPNMSLPADTVSRLHRRHQRRRIALPLSTLAATAVLAGGTFAAVDVVSSTRAVVTVPAATVTISPDVQRQQLQEVSQPAFAALQLQLSSWSSVRYYTVAGSLPFMIGQDHGMLGPASLLQDLQPPPPGGVPKVAYYDPNNIGSVGGPGAVMHDDHTGSVMVGGIGAPPLFLLPSWPTLTENVWVWSALPDAARTVVYVRSGQVVAAVSPLDHTAALRLPRPASPSEAGGELEALDADGHVLAVSATPWSLPEG